MLSSRRRPRPASSSKRSAPCCLLCSPPLTYPTLRSATKDELISHVKGGGAVIVLVDTNYLVCNKCAPRWWKRSADRVLPPSSYHGHYIILITYNESKEEFAFRDPDRADGALLGFSRLYCRHILRMAGGSTVWCAHALQTPVLCSRRSSTQHASALALTRTYCGYTPPRRAQCQHSRHLLCWIPHQPASCLNHRARRAKVTRKPQRDVDCKPRDSSVRGRRV